MLPKSENALRRHSRF